MFDPARGSCLCGAVRYRLEAPPILFYACHCRDCQRHAGMAYGLSMVVPADGLVHEQGELQDFDFETPEGIRRRGVVCPRCTGRLWGTPAKYPTLRNLRPGTLDEPHRWAPAGDMWTDSARPGVAFTGGPRYSAQPEEYGALIEAFRSQREAAAP